MAQPLAYLRTSTPAQTLSLEVQEAEVLAYCRSIWLDPPKLIYDAGVSASVPLSARPGGRMLMALVGSGGTVLAFRLDRLFRNTLDCLTVVDGWDALGVSLHLVELGKLDLRTPMARFLLTVSAATGELEAARAGEGTSKAMRQKAVRGEFTGGEPPFGKMVGLDGVLVECAREQAIVALVREYRADSMSLRKIVERLKEGGVVGRTGKPLAKTQLIKILSYVPA